MIFESSDYSQFTGCDENIVTYPSNPEIRLQNVWFLTKKPPAMQANIIRCLSQARTNWEGYGRKGIRHKNGGMMEVGALTV